MAFQPEFQAAYRRARAEPLREAVERLHGLLRKAAETLERNLTCGVPVIEVRAAVAVYELAFRGAELIDLAHRVTALEEQRKEGFP